jgi:hypothetical protein
MTLRRLQRNALKSEAVASVASSVEEQSAAMRKISANMQAAAQGVTVINDNLQALAG